jgi:hypothetical protein
MTEHNILQYAIERLLEDVSLTTDLIDDAAKLLLNWGVTQTKTVVQQMEGLSPEEIGARLADLRHTVKRISKEAGQAAPEAQAARVQTLLSEIKPETQATQAATPLSEIKPEEEKPEDEEWYTSSRNRYHLS